MPCFEQIQSWIEGGYGSVTLRFRVADTFDSLFLDSALCVPVSVFGLSSIDKDLQLKKGTLAEHEMSFSFSDASVRLPGDIQALNLVKMARISSYQVFVSLFINSDSSPSILQSDFIGLIQPEEEANDLLWHGHHYDQNPSPLRSWNVRARPFASAVLDKISVYELIYGSTDGKVPAVSSQWESVHVDDRDGFFRHTFANERKLRIRSLVSLNSVLHILASNYSAGLLARFGISLSFSFVKSELDGYWHPARWNHLVYQGHHPRYVQSPFSSCSYKCYPDDHNSIIIDPDNFLTAPLQKTFFISYGLIKPINDEPDKDQAKEFRWDKIKTFFELLQKLALAFGCFLDINFVSNSNLEIRFNSYSKVVGSRLYLKTSENGKMKGISSLAYDTDIPFYNSKSWYYALDGNDFYYKNTSSNSLERSDRLEKRKTGLDLILNIAPTVCMMLEGEDDFYYFYSPCLPHNHFMTDGGIRKSQKYTFSVGLHNALYIFSWRNNNHPNASDYENQYYYSPVGSYTLKIDGQDKQFSSLSEYNNFLNSSNSESFDLSYTLPVPGYFAFSSATDGSAPNWKIALGNTLFLDNVEYVIVGIIRSLTQPLVTLKLQAYARFNFDLFSGVSLSDPDAIIPMVKPLPPNFEYFSLGSDIICGQFVCLDSNGFAVRASELTDNYGRILGVATADGLEGDTAIVKRFGTHYFPNANFNVGSAVFLRGYATGSLNFSQSPPASDSDVLYCILGCAETTDVLRISQNPESYIL